VTVDIVEDANVAASAGTTWGGTVIRQSHVETSREMRHLDSTDRGAVSPTIRARGGAPAALRLGRRRGTVEATLTLPSPTTRPRSAPHVFLWNSV